MSIDAVSHVWKHSQQKSGNLLVLLALADHADSERFLAWPSIPHLATKARLSERQVQRCLRELEEAGEIAVARPGGMRDGKRRATVYRIAMLTSVEMSPQPTTDDADVTPTDDTDVALIVNRESSSSTSSKDSNESLSDGDKVASIKPMPSGQFFNKELAERVRAKREAGTSIHTPTEREKDDFGRQFKTLADKDGYDIDTLLLALDYQIAKASGEVEGEPKAWCGFRTAVDVIEAGSWRPKGMTKHDPKAAQAWAEIEKENERLLEDLL